MEKKISRRDLIKALIAGSGGIVAAGFVPEKWLQPVVKSGVLPAHAQASAPEPTPIPDYIQGGYSEMIDNQENFYINAYAFVSSQPIPEFGGSTGELSSIKKIGVDYPVEGKDVTLYVNDVKESTQKTDAEGYVSWRLDWDEPQINVQNINPGTGATLRFEMIDGFDEVVVPAWTQS